MDPIHRNYFILSPGRCGSIFASYVIMNSLNLLHNREDYCHMQHVKGTYPKLQFNTPTVIYHCHDLTFRHMPRNDCDLVLVLRRDQLGACLSFYLATHVFGVYTIDSNVHHKNKEIFQSKLEQIKQTGITVDLFKFKQTVDFFNSFYKFNINALKNCFIDIHTLYYEDFVNDHSVINKQLGIPEVVIPNNKLTEQLPYDKWSLINNTTEVINAYESRTTQ